MEPILNWQVFRRSGFVALSITVLIVLTEAYFSQWFPSGPPWGVWIFLFLTSSLALIAWHQGLVHIRRGSAWFLAWLVIGVMAAWAWLYLFVDQLPCFFGGKGC
jgi:hypothetical protein